MKAQLPDDVRRELVDGALRFRDERRRRRTRRVGLWGAVVAVLALALAFAFWPEDEQVRAGQSPTSTTWPGLGSSNPLGGPLATEEAAGATDEVASFLRALRDGDHAAAARRWSGYPEATGGDPDEAEAEKLVAIGELRGSQPWLVADPSPRLNASAGAMAGATVPIVTVEATGPRGPQAGAFVLRGSVEAGDLIIERLPTLAGSPRISVDPDSGVANVSFKGLPVEGGARVYLDGVEVPSALDPERHLVSVEVPLEEATGAVATVVVATPEVPTAAAFILDPPPA